MYEVLNDYNLFIKCLHMFDGHIIFLLIKKKQNSIVVSVHF